MRVAPHKETPGSTLQDKNAQRELTSTPMWKEVHGQVCEKKIVACPNKGY